MRSDVEICNQALTWLGSPEIVSLDESSASAKACKRVFRRIFEALLRAHVWSFAVRFATLAPLAEMSPDTDYDYQFALPVDCLRVLSLEQQPAFRVSGGVIFCSAAPITLRYVARISDYNLLDALFVDAFVYSLASELALAMTQDAGMAEYLTRQAQERLVAARSIGAMENNRATLPSRRSEWLEARY